MSFMPNLVNRENDEMIEIHRRAGCRRFAIYLSIELRRWVSAVKNVVKASPKRALEGPEWAVD